MATLLTGMMMKDVSSFQDGTNKAFAFHQKLNISGPEYNQLEIDEDILVSSGINGTHIFAEQHGTWE